LAFAEAASAAGRLIMQLRSDPGAIRRKADGSPVTDADERAEALLIERAHQIAPGLAILAEESFNPNTDYALDAPLLTIDPLDGTKEFLAGRSDFTVNIALLERRTPVLGCVYAPARGRCFLASDRAFSALLRPGDRLARSDLLPIHTRSRPATGMTAIVSRSHLDAKTQDLLATLPVAKRCGLGSSLKFCVIAEGRADIYPRLSPTMEWDTAAGHAVLGAAGGAVFTPKGAALRYGKASHRHHGFIAWGRAPGEDI